MTTHDPAQTETLMGVTVSKRDLARIPRQELGPPRCPECDWPLNPDGQCSRCAEDDSPPLLPRPDDAEAVERMARAMWEDAYSKESVGNRSLTWAIFPCHAKNEYRSMARAALAGLWEGK